MKDGGKHPQSDTLTEAMAASALSRAAANDASSSSVRTSRQRRGNSEASDTSETKDVGRNTVQEKTLEFFQMCDMENKGFITRRDMQRLNGGLPLSAEELENVFDTLDSDSNGFLTLQEFSSGFSAFLFGQEVSGEEGSQMGEKPQCKSPGEVLYQTQWEDGLRQREEDEEEKHFSLLMESLGANSVFEDPAEVRSLWAQLRRDEPHLLANFEDFLSRVTSQIIEANQEKKEMESALKRKAATHDNEIQHLYEEMEQQIKNEKDRIVLQDHERFLSRCQEMELQLSGKEREMEQLFQKQRRLEQQYQDLHSEQHVTKVANVKLKQTNDELARELDHTSHELVLAQEQLCLLQEQATRLHEEKEMEIYRLTEGLQRERASLLKQLDLLREMNKNLRDESDMCFQTPKKTPVLRQNPSTSTPKHPNPDVLTSDEEEQTTSSARQNLTKRLSQTTCIPQKRGHLQRIISIEEDHLPHLLQRDQLARSPLPECSETEETSDNEEMRNDPLMRNETPTSLRGRPVGKETSINDESAPSLPDRLFKVVMVGNSSVGKTSLLRRFCDDSFHPGTSATVGIDYSVKTITVDSSQVALQMWDTAGQERYRSITKQFFRKADGVVVMYDITAEQSFTAIRQWLTSIKESAGEDIPIMLLGNKTDKQMERQVQHEAGQRLAKESQLAFFECSASSGCNVMESMVHLARILKEQEDRVKEKTIQLVGSPSEKKKSCC
ncbi:ras and EF-hand domain-containing protein homolog isoform X1 [Takifugu rubripes]|uniref:Calcium release activated channel regulator 2A n=2 Tax=Takifugu rubripes TaxID=31033 RepID=A0A3B5K4M0_TAKRU|nr:EF-hand calcium-binding domain-containing protein 4B isoform X1 [Takifugu rubripes]XP_029697876.1 EF-hand calcium-binding domain-containing protein 4B isoform X1 [Takifugu rubripes]|eukprot:XP_003967247.2 PREDICTED: ras and EF-hand domain-containing protein homolog [Takifugu rubripes]